MKFILVNSYYPDDFLVRNRDMVMMIVERASAKVIKVTVVNREAMDNWLAQAQTVYTQDLYAILACNISIAGEIVGTVSEDEVRQKMPNFPKAWKN